jgi:selenocysteine lyase/cysteine desulfurase
MKNYFSLFEKYKLLHYFDSAATTLKPRNVISLLNQAYSLYTLPLGKSRYKEAEHGYDVVMMPIIEQLKSIFYARDYTFFFSHSVTILLKQIIDIFPFITNDIGISVLLPETVHNSFFLPLLKCKNYKKTMYGNDYLLSSFLCQKQYDVIYVPLIDHITGEEVDYNVLYDYKLKYPETIIIGDASQLGMYEATNLSNQLFDFFLLSSHKMYGPEGVAIVGINNQMMHRLIKNQYTHYLLKMHFGQGSLPYTAISAFKGALDFLTDHIYYNYRYKTQQQVYVDELYEVIKNNNNLVLVSPEKTKTIITFYHKKQHAHDIALFCSQDFNIAMRSGELCSPYVIESSKALLRISIGCYNDATDVEVLKNVLKTL